MEQDLHWSAKEAAKAGQKFRREARSVFAEYQRNLMQHLEEIRLTLKPKPRWVPQKMWWWMLGIFVNTDKLNTPGEVESPNDFLARKHHEEVAHRRKILYGDAPLSTE